MPVKKIVLVFPDTIKLSEFILLHRINNIQINTMEKTLTGVISTELIKKACKQYNAFLSKDKAHYC